MGEAFSLLRSVPIARAPILTSRIVVINRAREVIAHAITRKNRVISHVREAIAHAITRMNKVISHVREAIAHIITRMNKVISHVRETIVHIIIKAAINHKAVMSQETINHAVTALGQPIRNIT